MKQVAPRRYMLNDRLTDEEYIRMYRNDVLRLVDARSFIQDLERASRGRDVALCCFEKPGDFCHRHILAKWLNEQTGGLLEDQIQNVHMDPATVLALASTIYYRAKWTNEFGEGANTEDVFHGTAGDATATYMYSCLTYGPYYWGEDFGVVSLGLEDGSKMWLVLPDESYSPEDILGSGHALELILGNPYESENQKSLRVNLSLPKFDIVADRKLNDALKALGITDAFDPAKAEFSLIRTEDDCWLDSVDHAARVAIDEEGVTAAAYTVMLTCGAAMPPEEEMDFILDRPFLFVITSRDNLPLFAGVVNQLGS